MGREDSEHQQLITKQQKGKHLRNATRWVGGLGAPADRRRRSRGKQKARARARTRARPRVAESTSGIAPVGRPEPLRTIVVMTRAQYDEVWAAGGHPHCAFPTSYDELLRITGGEAAEVGD